jgi:hypothetical protein
MSRHSRWFLWLTQIGRDRALFSLPLWTLVTALNTSVLMGVIAMRIRRGGATELPGIELALVLALALAVFLVAAPIRTRCRRIDLTLPLSTRTLWWVHSIATYFGGLLVLLASVAVIAAHTTVLSRLAELPGTGVQLVGISMRLAGAWLLAVVAMQSYRADLRRPTGRRAIFLTLGLALGLLVLAAILATRPAVVTLAPVAMALLLGYRTLRDLPPSLALWPLEALPRSSPAVSPSRARAPRHPRPNGSIGARWASRILVAKTLLHTPPWGAATAWIALLFVALLGFLLSGVLGAWEPDADLRLWAVTMTIYMLLAFFGPLTFRLPILDPLPISRRHLFALLVLPAVLGLILGYAAGWLTQKLFGDPTETVRYRVEMPYYWVSVPYAYLEVAWDGEVPALTSPWGESHPASSSPLFRGSKALLYSPFNTPEESSADFEALLTSRAIERVHGLSIPYQEILERYLKVEGDRVVGLQPGGLTLAQDYPDLRRPVSRILFPTLLTLVVVPWFLLLAVVLRTFRANLGDRTRQVTFWSLLGLLLAAMIGQMVTTFTGLARPDVLRGTLEVVLRKIDSSATAAVALTLVCLASMIVSYLLAQRQFVNAEIPATPTRFTLLGPSQET